MKFTKISCAVLSTAIMVGCFVGCGRGNTADANVTEVEIWSNFANSKTTFNRLVQEFNDTTGKEKGIKIIYEVKEGDLNKTLELAEASGKTPDIASSYSKSKATDGIILPLNDFEGADEFLKRYEHLHKTGWGSVDGKSYVVPFSSTTFGLIYNKDMFKAAGIVDENGEAKPPKTWAEVREYAKKLTNAENREYGIVFPMKWSSWVTSDIIDSSMPAVGTSGFDPITGKYDYTPFKPVFDTILGMKEDGSVYPGAESLDNDPARARFSEGGIGMKFGYSWDVGVFNDQFPAQIDWGVAELPVMNENEKYKQQLSFSGLFTIYNKATENKDRNKVFEVYKWLHSDEVMTELYLNGLHLPPVDGMLLEEGGDNLPKGWKEFANMVSISTMKAEPIPADVSNQPTITELFINKVWTGTMTTEECLDQYTKIMNDGMAKYLEINPDFDINSRIDPDWDIHR